MSEKEGPLSVLRVVIDAMNTGANTVGLNEHDR